MFPSKRRDGKPHDYRRTMSSTGLHAVGSRRTSRRGEMSVGMSSDRRSSDRRSSRIKGGRKRKLHKELKQHEHLTAASTDGEAENIEVQLPEVNEMDILTFKQWRECSAVPVSKATTRAMSTANSAYTCVSHGAAIGDSEGGYGLDRTVEQFIGRLSSGPGIKVTKFHRHKSGVARRTFRLDTKRHELGWKSARSRLWGWGGWRGGAAGVGAGGAAAAAAEGGRWKAVRARVQKGVVPVCDLLDVELHGKVLWMKTLHNGNVGLEARNQDEADLLYAALEWLLDTRGVAQCPAVGPSPVSGGGVAEGEGGLGGSGELGPYVREEHSPASAGAAASSAAVQAKTTASATVPVHV